mmetsp:Transcript_7992/g.12083  ORF Transcript_7992/g.12083 Transcript_7992/m.12083 type:complete len:102 (+) Transcript_7992:104-409(+)
MRICTSRDLRVPVNELSIQSLNRNLNTLHSSPFAKRNSKTEPPASRKIYFSHSQPPTSPAAFLYPYKILSCVQRYTEPLRVVEIIGEITSERGLVYVWWWD